VADILSRPRVEVRLVLILAFVKAADVEFREPAFALLDSATDEMVQAWNDFQARLPAGEQANWSRDPPALLAVNAAVQQWTKDFEDKDKEDYESAKTNFATVCQTLDSYSGLFQFFPSGDKYFSAICGTITLIVKVSQTRN
jgi:hypothetical protein